QSLHNDDARHIAVTLPDGIELHNFYVPAGGDIPDPEENPKYLHKLRYVEEMTEWFARHRSKDSACVLVGDLNIAPLEHDVWSHKQLMNVVSHTERELERLAALKDSIGWVDGSRLFVPETEKLYSWWSYRNRDWKKSNRGRRLDHIWVTPPLRAHVRSGTILHEARDWEKPSDHVPVILEIA
ncbi:MAG: endonuclease/exonuclease/phosphatase family protein, partial [Rickettsiales bacterium]|nr:endonuclease/exonuclease/phosphatase family protein [Rickettsiales bacterium]